MSTRDPYSRAELEEMPLHALAEAALQIAWEIDGRRTTLDFESEVAALLRVLVKELAASQDRVAAQAVDLIHQRRRISKMLAAATNAQSRPARSAS